MPRFVHVADLHLGKNFAYLDDKKSKERSADLFEAFSRTIDFCCDESNQIEALWIAGDLFDSLNPPEELVNRVMKKFADLQSCGKEAFIVPGTHEPSYYPESVYRRYKFPGVTLLNSPVPTEPLKREYNGISFYFYGMEYHPLLSDDRLTFQAKDVEGYHVALVHGSLQLGEHWEIGDQYVPLLPEEIASWGMDYVALGHFHNFKQYQFGKTLAAYPGTLEGLSFRETGDRFLVAVNFEENEIIPLEKIPWNRKTISSVNVDLDREGIDSEEDIIEVIKSYSENGENILLKVQISGTAEFIIKPSYIKQEVGNDFFHFQLEDEFAFLNSSRLDSITRERSVRGLFVRKIREKLSTADDREQEVLRLALKITLSQLQGGERVEI